MPRRPAAAVGRHAVPVVEAADDARAHRRRHSLGLIAAREGAHEQLEVAPLGDAQHRHVPGQGRMNGQGQPLGMGQDKTLCRSDLHLTAAGGGPVGGRLTDPVLDREPQLNQAVLQRSEDAHVARLASVGAPGLHVRLVGHGQVPGRHAARLAPGAVVGEQLRRDLAPRAQRLQNGAPGLVATAHRRVLLVEVRQSAAAPARRSGRSWPSAGRRSPPRGSPPHRDRRSGRHSRSC